MLGMEVGLDFTASSVDFAVGCLVATCSASKGSSSLLRIGEEAPWHY